MLIKKMVADILTETRDILQDQQQSRYTNQELYRYLDQAVRNVALSTRFNVITQKIHVGLPLSTDTYTLDQEAIEFLKKECKQPYEIIDANTIKFPDNKDEEIKIVYYAFPKRVVYGVTLELYFDEDIYDMLKYFIAYRCYEKEASTEDIGKAQYFKGQYQELISLNATRWHGKTEVELYKKDFY